MIGKGRERFGRDDEEREEREEGFFELPHLMIMGQRELSLPLQSFSCSVSTNFDYNF